MSRAYTIETEKHLLFKSAMGSFPAKLIVTMFVVCILLGCFLAESASQHSGGEKGIWWFPGCQGRSAGKMVPGNIRSGSGCGTRMITGAEATTWFQSLRKRRSPPPPKRNLSKGFRRILPPPPPPKPYVLEPAPPAAPPPPFPSLKNPSRPPKKNLSKRPKKNPPKPYVQRPTPPPAAPPPPSEF